MTTALLFALAAAVDAAPDAARVDATLGLQANVAFTDYPPPARTPELIRRLFSPLQAQRANEAIAKSAHAISDESLDLAHETFTVYVPPERPPGGYALLVFVPPWEEATLPPRWTPELDRHGMLFVTAAHSGNAASVLDRREPLALVAAYNIARRYRIDPARVYVGGFSGGSRVALRLALAYPDLFHGALLNAGSDPIGTVEIPLPPADLFREFQERSRIVYLTGKEDAPRLDMDEHSRRSLQDWCVFDVRSVLIAWSGHEAPSSAAFNQGLEALEAHESPAPDKLASCRRRYEDDLAQRVHELERLQADGDERSAAARRTEIDQHFGGLAASALAGDAHSH